MVIKFTHDLSIRQITVEDIDYIVAIETDQIDALYPNDILSQLFAREYKKRWKHKLHAGMHTLILLVQDKRLGFISYSTACVWNKPDSTIAEINQIYIKPEIRGLHLGRLLCKTAIEEIRQKNFNTVIVWLAESHRQTQRFYENLGFKVTSLIREEVIMGDVVLREIQYQLILC